MKHTLLPLLLLATLAQAQIRPDSALMRTDPYQAILQAQCLAVASHSSVDYSPWRDSLIRIVLPPNPKPVPLAWENDFCNMVLEVTNTEQDLFLFAASLEATPFEVTPQQVDSGLFPQLPKGRYLLILSDQTPWTFRQGLDYHVYRQDLLVVEDGAARNRPVMPYSTPSTRLQASLVRLDSTRSTTFENLHLRRTPQSTHQTRLVSCRNCADVTLRHLSVATPQYRPLRSRVAHSLPPTASSITSRTRTPYRLEHDGVVSLSNCAYVTLDDIVVDGTYTVPGSYGYAFSIGNTYQLQADRLLADAHWGVFGSNNMSETSLSDCLLNRFDIHCYGRNVHAQRCTLFGKQTQFSSFYGTLRFTQCLFDDCIPVRIRGDYNAHTPFAIFLDDCTFRPTLKYHHLVNIILQDTARNPRPELSERHYPTLYVEGLRVERRLPLPAVRPYHLTGDRRACRQARLALPTPQISAPPRSPQK